MYVSFISCLFGVNNNVIAMNRTESVGGKRKLKSQQQHTG